MSDPQKPETPAWLLELRAEIDAIDDQLIGLLSRRCEFVEKVGKLKAQHSTGKSKIRPGREADMVRRIYGQCGRSKFPAPAAVSLWRTIIAASTNIETPLTVSAYTPEHNLTNYWLAREYFGPFTPVAAQPLINRVIGDVMEGKAEVGIVPVPQSDDHDPWWQALAQEKDGLPKIFAFLPFAVGKQSEQREFTALAIANIDPEPTGSDITYAVFEMDDVSTHRLQQALAQAEIPAKFLQMQNLSVSRRQILAEVPEFLTQTDAKWQNFLSALGTSIVKVTVLGSYATPIETQQDHSPVYEHVKRPHALKPAILKPATS